MIFTKDDDVYEFENYVRKNYNGIAFIKDESIKNELMKESKVKELCQKDVYDIRSGFFHTIARTKNGKVHIWGRNIYGVLGNGKEDANEISYPKIHTKLSAINLIDVCCGDYHSLALTADGEIYSWGLNDAGQIGNGENSGCQPELKKIEYLTGVKIKAISCGLRHSMVLTEDGRAFSCGANTFGQLGRVEDDISNKFKQIDLKNIIKKISCGITLSLLLTTEGDIYVCGSYDDDLEKKGIRIAEKLIFHEKFVDIKTIFYKNICTARTKEGSYYVWGKWEKRIISEPEKIFKNSFDDIFIEKMHMLPWLIDGKIIEFDDSIFRNGLCKGYYQVKDKLGEGAYGVVYKASFKDQKNYFAIKKIIFKKEDDYDFDDFINEIGIYSLIWRTKPNKRILNLGRFWLEKNQGKPVTLFIEMELCNMSLNEFIETLKKDLMSDGLINFNYYISSEIFIGILEGVNFLHKQKPQIIHRDLKPDNILLKIDQYNFHIKIADFGLATLHKFADQSHKPDKGDLSYIASEVINSEIYDTKSDIYSLGMILKDLFLIDLDG
jgi:tRNA A-37 threonylcarbamoyl transferase component Bud32